MIILHIISEISLKLASFLRWETGTIKKSLQKFSIVHPPNITSISSNNKLDVAILPLLKKSEPTQHSCYFVIKVHFFVSISYLMIESKNLNPFVPPYTIKSLSSIRALIWELKSLGTFPNSSTLPFATSIENIWSKNF